MWKSIALSDLSIYYIWKNIKRSYNNNKFKISARAWNDKFELPDESHSVSDIPRLFWVLRENTDKKSIRIYINSIENIVTFKIRLDIILNF